MNGFFKEINQYNIVPPKWKLSIVIVSSIVILLLYFAILVLTVYALGNSFQADTSDSSQADTSDSFQADTGDSFQADTNRWFCISILENILTFFSLFLAIIATHISNCIQDSCINCLKRIYESNPFLQDEFKISEVTERIEKDKRSSKNIKRVVLVSFFLYFVMSVLHKISIKSMMLQDFAWGLGSISTVLSVVLAITSSFSCYIFGNYVMVLLEMLNEGLNLMFDKYNNRCISDSFERAFDD